MYIIKIVRKGSGIINIYSCEDFNILGAEMVFYRKDYGGTTVYLSPFDTIFIMDTSGNTIDSFKVALVEVEED